jgi:imidazoleglycerol phosphate dehydratase HisB
MREQTVTRNTAETQISLTLDMDRHQRPVLDTPCPSYPTCSMPWPGTVVFTLR